jgi:hypothetical protein
MLFEVENVSFGGVHKITRTRLEELARAHIGALLLVTNDPKNSMRKDPEILFDLETWGGILGKAVTENPSLTGRETDVIDEAIRSGDYDYILEPEEEGGESTVPVQLISTGMQVFGALPFEAACGLQREDELSVPFAEGVWTVLKKRWVCVPDGTAALVLTVEAAG